MTPREGKDTVSEDGCAPGLSLSHGVDDAVEPGKPYQWIDVSALPANLGCFDDDPALPGGRPGHASIVPLDAQGNIDHAELLRWSATRDDDQPDAITQAVLGCMRGGGRRPK